MKQLNLAIYISFEQKEACIITKSSINKMMKVLVYDLLCDETEDKFFF